MRFLLPRLFLLALLGLRLSAAPPAAPGRLRVDDVAEPVGTGAAVWFGWQVNDPDPDEIQSACRILVSSSSARLAAGEGDLWDSGRIPGRLQNHVLYAGVPLQGDRRYHWKVRTWDKDGQAGPWSAPATFVVGPTDDAGWAGAHWIRRDSADKDDYTLFRKKVALSAKAVERATVYVAAVHKYALYLNGILVGRGPAYQHPQYQYYNAYDVTGIVQAGADNQFALFQHWFGGGQGRPAGERGVLLKAVVHHADGSVTEIGTDATWRQSRAAAWVTGQPDRNRGEGVGYVECIDALEFRSDWVSAGFDDSSWGPVNVIGPHPTAPWTGRLSPDLTCIDETVLAPASIVHKGGGKYVVDLGKVHAGRPRIRFSGGASGDIVSMRGAYTLDASGEIPSGTKSQATLMEYRAVLDGGVFTYEPVEYLGMRYFQIDNAPMPVGPDNFSFVARHSRMDASASSFASSNPTLDAVWGLMKDSLLTCAQEEFVDTPTREKGGFLGDSAIQSTVAMPVMNERALTQRVLGEFLQSMGQHWSKPDDRGRMNAVYPNRDGGRDIPDFTQAFLPWVWSYYLETGDRAFLSAHYARLSDIADYVHRHTDPATGLVTRLTGGSGAYQYGIVDWPAPMRFGYDMETTARTVINGWAHADYQAMARIAAELGNSADRDTWRARAGALKTAINARLRNDAGVYIDGLSAEGTPSAHVSQHANIFPLALDLVPDSRRAAVVDKVRELRMSVGMVTVSWLVRALGEAGEGPQLLDLFTREDWPGWARCLARGATATWESWDSDTVKDESLSHAWGAAGLEGYLRYVLGIRPLKPQYEEVLIQPLDFADKLEWAGGHLTTDRGEIAVRWSRAPGSYELRVKLPGNVTAQVALPAGAAARPSVHLDGRPVQAVREGGRLVLSGVGSGEHRIVRFDAPVEGSVETSRRVSIVDSGAVGDGTTLNTPSIQCLIDRLAEEGGGSVLVPRGVFVSGALFFKPGVHLHLEKEAILKCSPDLKNFPPRRTRIEGHFEEAFNPALINVDGCDDFHLSGEGILDGAGRSVWDLFWKLRNASTDKANFRNLSVPRARLCLIENSRNVVVEGVTFKDSQFWNLHLYRCRDVLVRDARFQVPDDYTQAPSSDGIDVDSCQDVTVQGCHFSVTDDCIAMKGSKGPRAREDKDSPPVERVRVRDCVFKRGHAAVTLGSEATVVRDVVVEDCRVLGGMAVLNFKLRSDTPQHYEDIHYRGIVLEGRGGSLLSIRPWTQYADLQGLPPPSSVVRNVTLSNIRGRYGAFGSIRGNPGQTEIDGIRIEDLDLRLQKPKLELRNVKNLRVENVAVNGEPFVL